MYFFIGNETRRRVYVLVFLGRKYLPANLHEFVGLVVSSYIHNVVGSVGQIVSLVVLKYEFTTMSDITCLEHVFVSRGKGGNWDHEAKITYGETDFSHVEEFPSQTVVDRQFQEVCGFFGVVDRFLADIDPTCF